jgi:hypothetical protein
MQLSKVERKNIGSTWSRITCLDSPLAAAQSHEGYQSSQRLNNHDRKQAIQTINKTIYQIVPKY